MKKLTAALAIGLVSASAFAAQGDILARFRVINVNPDVSSTDTLSAIHTDVKSSTVPEVDFTYMITNNIGAELILGTSRHELKSDLGSLGKVSVLPPTLTVQYHFNPEGSIRPYAGVGVNYTRFYSNDLKVGSSNVDIDKNSWGLAAQVGVDVAINKDWFVNVDVKKIQLDTRARLNGADIGKLTLDPWVFGLGIGTKF